MSSVSLSADRLKSFFAGPQALWAGVFIAGCCLLMYSAASLYGFFYSESVGPDSGPTPGISTQRHHHDMTLSYSLFGNYIPRSNDKNAIPKTLLNIKLVGVLKASKKILSQVTIQVAGGKEKNYSLGDTLPGGAKIIRIYDDGVLLLRNGQMERLSLPVTPLPSANQTKPLEFEP